ncbi:Aste57867_1408 [Aphanomyces stellatus]|uniref:Aste57867_1408 protein n=1 Tax=Aphanomyces stellatus TaxID=120398 RepID=A0A485K8H6_9STRA|nr:hypothetical protein As57867_001407 [Aphanomyces stellatus]VFT78625.1 Aste57867_1408 [Aphanomyces stellatus]
MDSNKLEMTTMKQIVGVMRDNNNKEFPELNAKRMELEASKRSIQIQEQRQHTKEARLLSVAKSTDMLREQTKSLESFRQKLNSMTVGIDLALNCINHVLTNSSHPIYVIQALEACTNQSSGNFAIAWEGLGTITSHLKQSERLLVGDAQKENDRLKYNFDEC